MDNLSNCQLKPRPRSSGFLDRAYKRMSTIDYLKPILSLLLFLQIATVGFGQTTIITPVTPFPIDPNNPPGCNQNNVTIIQIQFRDTNGDIIDPNDLDGTPIGTPIDGEIWADFTVSGQSNAYNVHIQYDLFFNGVQQGSEPVANCVVFKNAQNQTVRVENGYYKLSDFSWNYGDEVQIQNLYYTWKTGNPNPNDESCPTGGGNSQCFFSGEGLTVYTPLVSNFSFETNCDDLSVQFTQLVTGGDPEFVPTYSWDFDTSNGIGTDSSDPNPSHTYPTAGTYTVRLTATKEGITKYYEQQVTVYGPVSLVVNNPAGVCSPATVDLTAAAITNGSSSDLTFTYWEDDQANVPLANPGAVGVAGTYYIKATHDFSGCEVIQPVVVTIGQCSIALVKEAVNAPDPGDCLDPTTNPTINYTFTVTNNGGFDLSNIQISDPLFEAPNPVVALTLSDNGNGDAVLAVNETWIYTASYTITPTDIQNGQVQNQATVSGEAFGNTVQDLSGSATDNDTPTVVPICQNPVINILKSGVFNDENNDTYADEGETISYTFSVSNGGDVSLTNITVTDPLPGLSTPTYQSGDDGDGILEVGETWVYTATYSVTQADIDAGQVDNTATADSDESEIDTDSETVNLAQNASITIEKDGTYEDTNLDGVANVGDKITYVFTVENTGNVTLTDVMVTDPLVTVVGGPIASLAPGETDNTTFTAEYLLQQSDINAGTFTNTATVTGTPPVGADVTDDDSDT
ncbi:conserved repeat domain-containing protein, partial [Algoriphagus zhangzhouensis]